MLFERGAACVGLDFLAHPFWDKYLEYEERQEAQENIYALLARIARIPMHQYARYYEKYRTLTHSRPIAEIAPADVIARFKSEVESETQAYGGGPRPELVVLREFRGLGDALYYWVFTNTQNYFSTRCTY
jgi:pre-mRNA-processing factor 39